MEYRSGFTIKPREVLKSGQVVFTDGRNDVLPNQADCEAYGYTYNTRTRVCEAYHYSTRTEEAISNENNFIKGDRNRTETATANSIIVGQSNTTKGNNRNGIIIGDSNEIANGVNNASVFGNYGLAERDGEFVVGGGGFNGAGRGYAQSSTITLTGTTTDDTATNLFVNGDPSTTIIARSSTSSFQAFEANVIGIRTGGSSALGAVNDRIFLRATGIVYLKADDQSVETLGEFGVTRHWTAEVAFSGTNDMLLQVKGRADMNLSWSATLNLYEMIV